MIVQQKKQYSLFFFILLCISAVFFSCSDSIPELQEVYFHHYGTKETDDEKMVVFVKLESNIENIQSIKIKHISSGLEWIIENPEIIKDKKSNNYYCGSTNLVPETGDSFFGGEYTVEYSDRAGRKTETQFFYIKNKEKE